jgi:hypothetical protein
MVERAAFLVDHVLPHVRTRQWVLSLPFELRYRLAFDHELCRAVLGVFVRALSGFHRKRARARGIRGGRTGAVTVIQRAGGALNLNVHFHTIALDGVFTESAKGNLRFHPARAPSEEDVGSLLETIRTRILRLLERRGLLGEEAGDHDPPPLGAVLAASVQQSTATGERAGQKIRRLRSAADVPPRRTRHRGARIGGFDLQASASVRARSRDRLERLCRYILRPPVPLRRLEESRGKILLRLSRPWNDGSTHVVFEPTELLEKLAVLVPRPNVNLLIYHGLLAGNAKWRSRVVAHGRPPSPTESSPRSDTPPRRNATWAELMRRGLDIDVLACPQCGGRLKLIATITDPHVAQRIVTHLGLEPPDRARAPPPDPEPPRPMSALRAHLERIKDRLLRHTLDPKS